MTSLCYLDIYIFLAKIHCIYLGMEGLWSVTKDFITDAVHN